VTQQFFVPGKLPSLNDLIAAAKGAGGRGIVYAKLKAQWTSDIAFHIKAARIRPVEGRAYLRFIWREGNQKRDPDNVAAGGRKLILDALVVAKVLKDDAWEFVAGWNDAWVLDARPGVEVALFTSPQQ
jgi:hypothetical protein